MSSSGFDIEPLPLDGAFIIRPPVHGDHRGYFAVPYNRDALAAAGIRAEFIQDNQSMSEAVGTVRGLHLQVPPYAQAKLVRVLRGRVLDVLVDVRRGSPSYGKHYALELSESGGEQVFVPCGFLHGFVTREPGTIVHYKVDNHYAPEAEVSVRWDDIDLAIDWGLGTTTPVLSGKDADGLNWAAFNSPFELAEA